MAANPPPFEISLDRYQKARAMLGRAKILDRALERVDHALDDLMAAPSPSYPALGEKLEILEQEYGAHAQPRHMTAIYADAAALRG